MLRRYLVNVLSENFLCCLWLNVRLIRYQLWAKLGITRDMKLIFNALAHILTK